MDSLSNKLAAYILLSGKHAEFVTNPNPEIKNAFDGKAVYSSTEDAYIVSADSLVFSHGVRVENANVELMLGITPVHKMLFALDNAEGVPRSLVLRAARNPKKLRVAPKANAFRRTYAGLFGINSELTDLDCMLNNDSIRQAECMELFYSDITVKRFGAIVDGADDVELSNAMSAGGITFIAARLVDKSGPSSVFWANGNYMHGATEYEAQIFSTLIKVCQVALHTHRVESLLGKARGFCPHLLD